MSKSRNTKTLVKSFFRVFRRRLKKRVSVRPIGPSDRWALSTPLLQFSKYDSFTIGNAVEGVLCLGAIGSGKSSGTGKTLAHALLRAGFGALVLTAKPGDREEWERYCAETGREDDLVQFSPLMPFKFDPIDFEYSREGAGAGQTHNIVNLFTTLLEIAEGKSGQSSGGDNATYFKNATQQLLRNVVDLITIAKERVNLQDMYRLVISAPTTLTQATSPEWQARSFLFQCLSEADKKPKTPSQQIDFGLVADYFMLEYPGLPDRTRSGIVSTFTSTADLMLRGVLRDLFCSGSNIDPTIIERGYIVVVDLSVKEYGEVGRLANALWKYAFQKSIERRDIGSNPRPVTLFMDEGHLHLNSYDSLFQSTSRSSRVATVLLTQNVPNLLAALGGDQTGKAQADSLMGNFGTKIFHANSDVVTNEWAASLIGKRRQFMLNMNSSQQHTDVYSEIFGGASQSSGGMSEQINFEVEPSVFAGLRNGGPPNDFKIDGIVFRHGQPFRASRRNWMPVQFNQT